MVTVGPSLCLVFVFCGAQSTGRSNPNCHLYSTSTAAGGTNGAAATAPHTAARSQRSIPPAASRSSTHPPQHNSTETLAPKLTPLPFPPLSSFLFQSPPLLVRFAHRRHAPLLPSSLAMVFLADSSSSRIQRSLGRSMRTLRSNLFRNDPPAGASPQAGSAAVSENLTDSLVDFQLQQLAVGPPRGSDAKSAASSAESVSEILELSRDFSDCSGFSSDISGELQRLASAPPAEAQPSPSASAAADAEAYEFVFALSSSSLEAIESASVESIGPAVGACVEALGASSPELKRAAAAGIRLLAKHRSDFRALIGASGSISALVPLLKSIDPATQESAVTALLNLSLEEENKKPITTAGAIKPMVYALRTGTAVAKQNAACALLSLSMIEENRGAIGACGAIPPLVSLLVSGSSRGKKDSLTTLYKLCSVRRNKERAISAGAVPPLVELVGERGGGTVEKALVVLGSLAAVPEGKDAVAEAGGIPVLVEAMETGPTAGREFAVHALLQLAAESPHIQRLLLGEGAIPPLVELSQAGSTRAKRKAAMLLGYLRELRH
ncbi:U-box domain-containing protein 4-like [Zingiber officinale]|uniref:U-box domain-containing protein 4-like n=1 Tax=Zingiber officinale TaxID=94328 RepID=UPI001C4CB96F|nr:U-box domain-containing protein 4-like [Zingiber officinale]XP_042458044.1 U-box domain-containing protein 4-like [Zingiber officinale]